MFNVNKYIYRNSVHLVHTDSVLYRRKRALGSCNAFRHSRFLPPHKQRTPTRPPGPCNPRDHRNANPWEYIASYRTRIPNKLYIYICAPRTFRYNCTHHKSQNPQNSEERCVSYVASVPGFWPAVPHGIRHKHPDPWSRSGCCSSNSRAIPIRKRQRKSRTVEWFLFIINI